jgi:hypothetical protein
VLHPCAEATGQFATIQIRTPHGRHQGKYKGFGDSEPAI